MKGLELSRKTISALLLIFILFISLAVSLYSNMFDAYLINNVYKNAGPIVNEPA